MMLLIVILAIAVILLIYAIIETGLLKTVSYDIETPGIPDSINGKRIVFLSDLHCTRFGRHNRRLTDMIAKAAPSMIIIGGDVVNGRSNEHFEYAEELFTALARLNVPVYYSFGNHEYRLIHNHGKKSTFRSYYNLSKQYCNLLNNDSVKLGKGDKAARIFGLALPLEQFKKKVSEGLINPVSDYLGTAQPSDYNILIAHDPSYYKDYLEWGADLILSGHLHGGIIRLPFFGGLISPRYSLFPKPDKGLYRYEGDKTMVISGGIGWHGLPLRFLNRPEIIVLNMRRTSGS